LNCADYVLAGFRKQFPGPQAAFWMIFREIGSCLKARTSFLKRGNEEFSELITDLKTGSRKLSKNCGHQRTVQKVLIFFLGK
jgi:hypothetical protein